MFEEALAAAAELDEFMKVKGRPKGPLHGLPISVKEHVYLAGTPATSGFVAWADDISLADALIVKVFRDAGAVFHVKTTNPQGLMALETVSNLYGTTTNPFNTNLTPGGSSGGESALIAMRGSLLGIGTDIGGSIRVPAAFCGLYGLKPSVARLPHGGLSGAHGGMENIIGCVGPLATSLEDMRLFCDVSMLVSPATMATNSGSGGIEFRTMASRTFSSRNSLEIIHQNSQVTENWSHVGRWNSSSTPPCYQMSPRDSNFAARSRTHHHTMEPQAAPRSH